MSRRWLLGIARWRVNGAAFYEQAHENDEANAHQQDSPPVLLYYTVAISKRAIDDCRNEH